MTMLMKRAMVLASVVRIAGAPTLRSIAFTRTCSIPKPFGRLAPYFERLGEVLGDAGGRANRARTVW